MLICTFGFLVLRCAVTEKASVGMNVSGIHRVSGYIGSLAPSTPPPPRVRYPQVVTSYDALNISLSALKASYNDNRDAFLPMKALFESSIFNEFEVDFDGDAKDDVYASLRYEVSYVTNLKTVIKTLTSYVDQFSRNCALSLLYRLRASAMYIREIIDENEGILNKVNLNLLQHSNNLKALNSLKSYLDEMLRLRNIVIDMAKGMLEMAVKVVGDNANIQLALEPITSAQGKLKEIINSGMKLSLRDLRTKIESTVDSLRLQVLRGNGSIFFNICTFR
nr:hypothetical protein [Borrelia turicatae]